jgi:hypothetical protein
MKVRYEKICLSTPPIKRIVKGIETDESLQLGNDSDGESD